MGIVLIIGTESETRSSSNQAVKRKNGMSTDSARWKGMLPLVDVGSESERVSKNENERAP
jgi:hypothetical protein